MSSDKPFFATGEIVSDYSLLKKYWELLKLRGKSVEPVLLSRQDFDYIKRLIGRRRIRLDEIYEELIDYFAERIDPDIAAEAYEKVYGVRIEPETARRKLAEIMAGWLLEASSFLGDIKINIPWKNK